MSASSSCSMTEVRICSAIFFSKFERTLTEYHRFAICLPALSRGTCSYETAPEFINLIRPLARYHPNTKRRATRIAARRNIGLVPPFTPQNDLFQEVAHNLPNQFGRRNCKRLGFNRRSLEPCEVRHGSKYQLSRRTPRSMLPR